MKRHRSPALLALLALSALALVAPIASIAAGAPASKPAPAMTRYLVSSPHTEAECLKTLDDVSATGGLAKWQFGCMDGDHTGYLITMAPSAEAALANVPASVRAKARAVKIHTFTAAELKEAHSHMSAAK